MIPKVLVFIKNEAEKSLFEEALGAFLEKGCAVFFVHTKAEALHILDKEHPNLVFVESDLIEYKREGTAVIEKVHPFNERHIKEACRASLDASFMEGSKPLSM